MMPFVPKAVNQIGSNGHWDVASGVYIVSYEKRKGRVSKSLYRLGVFVQS